MSHIGPRLGGVDREDLASRKAVTAGILDHQSEIVLGGAAGLGIGMQRTLGLGLQLIDVAYCMYSCLLYTSDAADEMD